MKETKNLEFKSDMSNTFLKTVSAYANYGCGEILFGVDDEGNYIRVNDPKKLCLDIENKINDNIEPRPIYRLSINNNKNVVTLTVQEGVNKPYFYKNKAYKRNDTATVEVDRLELTRLILEGKNTSFEETASANQVLSFNTLENLLKETLGIESLTKDILTTLELYHRDHGYNKAADLLSDQNDFPGIDAVRFGENISIIHDREVFEHMSILRQYFSIVDMYRKYYQYEEIKGSVRESKEIIPEAAFRETIANALVHRTWDVDARVSVSMFKDRIEISSPGGLPSGISKEEYLSGGISIPRNPIIGNVFLRLRLIERFGTGVRRIIETYKDAMLKPQFLVTDNMIKVTLPVIINTGRTLSENEKAIINILKEHGAIKMSSTEISKLAELGKTSVVSLLNRLTAEGYVTKNGGGRGTTYSLK